MNNDNHFLRAAAGLATLGMYQEAENELLEIPPTSECFPHSINALLTVQLALGQYHRAVQTGFRLMQLPNGSSRSILFRTSIALTFCGSFLEARTLMERLPKLGINSSAEAYQMACLESRLGYFNAALAWLKQSLTLSEDYRAKCLIDSDLEPLWRALPIHDIGSPQASILLHARFEEFTNFTWGREHDLELDWNDLKQLPEAWQRLFYFQSETGSCSIHALTAAKDPANAANCLAYFQRRLQDCLGNLEIARKVARTLVAKRLPVQAQFKH